MKEEQTRKELEIKDLRELLIKKGLPPEIEEKLCKAIDNIKMVFSSKQAGYLSPNEYIEDNTSNISNEKTFKKGDIVKVKEGCYRTQPLISEWDLGIIKIINFNRFICTKDEEAGLVTLDIIGPYMGSLKQGVLFETNCLELATINNYKVENIKREPFKVGDILKFSPDQINFLFDQCETVSNHGLSYKEILEERRFICVKDNDATVDVYQLNYLNNNRKPLFLPDMSSLKFKKVNELQ